MFVTDGVGVGKFVPDGGGVPVWELDGVMDGDCVGDTVFVGVGVSVDVLVGVWVFVGVKVGVGVGSIHILLHPSSVCIPYGPPDTNVGRLELQTIVSLKGWTVI